MISISGLKIMPVIIFVPGVAMTTLQGAEMPIRKKKRPGLIYLIVKQQCMLVSSILQVTIQLTIH